MKENEFPVLKITNIDWDKDHEELDKLPRDLELRWDSQDWNTEEVSNWLSIKFDWIFHGVNIEQIGTWESGGCSCC
jgi:hypothetical protein|tara:strand:- start:241 stop:468 length:228 start_codon:yes stop_codon:yes gene_type:complete